MSVSVDQDSGGAAVAVRRVDVLGIMRGGLSFSAYALRQWRSLVQFIITAVDVAVTFADKF